MERDLNPLRFIHLFLNIKDMFVHRLVMLIGMRHERHKTAFKIKRLRRHFKTEFAQGEDIREVKFLYRAGINDRDAEFAH